MYKYEPVNSFEKVLVGILDCSRICGFLCAIALLILLFLIPIIFATDRRVELDKEGESGMASNKAKQDNPDGAVHHRGRSVIICNTSSTPYYIQAAINDIYAREQRQDMYRAVTALLILAALHAILIPWVFELTSNQKSLGVIICASYPVLEIVWYVLFLKNLFAKRFRETSCFNPARIICVIDLIPIAAGDVLLIPLMLFSLLVRFITRNISW